MKSSYAFRNITKRTTLLDGTQLQSKYYGPDVNSSYSLGSFQEDYQYIKAYGDLGDIFFKFSFKLIF